MSLSTSLGRTLTRTLFLVFLTCNATLSLATGVAPVVGGVKLPDNRHGYMGYPQASNEEDQVYVSRRQYLINWNVQMRGPAWVAWLLNKRYLGSFKRTNKWKMDADLHAHLKANGHSAVSADEFRGSCMDRGHQVASSDRTASENDNESTFLMSNIAPQAAFLNRRTWNSFERFLRNLVEEQGKEVYIYAGASQEIQGKIGVNADIIVPKSNFKVILVKPAGYDYSLEKMRVLAVDFPNLTSRGTNPVRDVYQACYDQDHTPHLEESNRQPYWRKLVTDLKSIETLTGLDFSFLSQISPFTDDEIDQLIQEQLQRSNNFFNLQQFITDSLDLN